MRGGKPLDLPQASPDENRPSNEQSDAEAVQDDSESEAQAGLDGMQRPYSSDHVNGEAQLHAVNGMHSRSAASDLQLSHVSQGDALPQYSQAYASNSNGSALAYPFHT